MGLQVGQLANERTCAWLAKLEHIVRLSLCIYNINNCMLKNNKGRELFEFTNEIKMENKVIYKILSHITDANNH